MTTHKHPVELAGVMDTDQSVEILRLRATVRDLLALSIIPETWAGREPPAIAADFADLLIELLDLDFAFVRLCDPTGCQLVEVTRGNSWKTFPEWLQQQLTVSDRISRKEIVGNVNGIEEACCGIVIPIGVDSKRGLVAAASDRSGFPDQIDQQLLSVAANNAATAFQNAILINELHNVQEAVRNNEQKHRKARDEVVADVTDRRRSEEQHERLRQLEAELAHVNRVSMLGEMAASLAHEIKQPLTAAITSANACIEWLAREPPNLDRARAAAARIDKYGNRAAQIIDHMRSLYKKSPSLRELVDVNGIVHEISSLLQGETSRYSIDMRLELAADLPKIKADRVQLQQVFMNLMLNAVEAMQDSGGELTVTSQMQDGQLLFSVSDTGMGLPTDNIDQIFSAFFTTKPQGSGMGLAISMSIVESHGGRLWATATDGQGATFRFTLPMHVTE